MSEKDSTSVTEWASVCSACFGRPRVVFYRDGGKRLVCEHRIADVSQLDRIASLEAELATVRESNVRLARENAERAAADEEWRVSYERLTLKNRELRRNIDTLSGQIEGLKDALEDLRRTSLTDGVTENVPFVVVKGHDEIGQDEFRVTKHFCKPPLGNPTREEAIAALRRIIRQAEWVTHDPAWESVNQSARQIQDIARAALPKTEPES